MIQYSHPALVAQWIELFRPKEEIWVRFLSRAQTNKMSEVTEKKAKGLLSTGNEEYLDAC